jgi:hypothetical protein
MRADPEAPRERPGGEAESRAEPSRLTLSRREVLGGASGAALMAVLGCGPPTEAAPGEPWDDGTYWDDGTGWL